MLRLPEPMLARPGPIPTGRGWLFEPKLDGFRCLVCTHGGRFRARSRRGWEMSDRLHELHHVLPADVQLDGELVTLDDTGVPDFHRLGSRMLHGATGVAITYFVFDVLAVEGLPVTAQPHLERRALLEQLDVESLNVKLVATFEDGQALFDVICDRGLEGVVAKRERDPYRPGELGWVKTKDRQTARFAQELEGARSARRRSLVTRQTGSTSRMPFPAALR